MGQGHQHLHDAPLHEPASATRLDLATGWTDHQRAEREVGLPGQVDPVVQSEALREVVHAAPTEPLAKLYHGRDRGAAMRDRSGESLLQALALDRRPKPKSDV